MNIACLLKKTTFETYLIYAVTEMVRTYRDL